MFRAESHDTMMAWYEDIKALTEKSPEERSAFVRTHSRSLSRSSRRSVSSDGIVDEDDDEPFAANPMDINSEPRDESVSRRPQPGGRFPSDLQINAQRGLQASQSPSSVSSGRQDYPSDAPAYAAAAGALPVAAYAAGHESQPAEQYRQESHMGYGGTDQTPMENMPSHAAIASRQAHHDGINPYTSEPLSESTHRDGGYFAGTIIGTEVVNPEKSDDKINGDEDVSGKQPHSELDGPRQVDAAETGGSHLSQDNGDNHGNRAAVDETNETIALAGSNVSRSETKHELPLQIVPEAQAADHVTPLTTPLGDTRKVNYRQTDNRTNSIATISNLPIPGKFPKHTVVTPQ